MSELAGSMAQRDLRPWKGQYHLYAKEPAGEHLFDLEEVKNHYRIPAPWGVTMRGDKYEALKTVHHYIDLSCVPFQLVFSEAADASAEELQNRRKYFSSLLRYLQGYDPALQNYSRHAKCLVGTLGEYPCWLMPPVVDESLGASRPITESLVTLYVQITPPARLTWGPSTVTLRKLTPRGEKRARLAVSKRGIRICRSKLDSSWIQTLGWALPGLYLDPRNTLTKSLLWLHPPEPEFPSGSLSEVELREDTALLEWVRVSADAQGQLPSPGTPCPGPPMPSPARPPDHNSDSKQSTTHNRTNEANGTNEVHSKNAGAASTSGHDLRVSSSFLLSNAQHHDDWVLGGLAELVDNALDAGARNLSVHIQDKSGRLLTDSEGEYGEPVMVVMDDGTGVSWANMTCRMLALGHKVENTPDKIGMYGMGFKTGSMCIGKDALVITRYMGKGGPKPEIKVEDTGEQPNKDEGEKSVSRDQGEDEPMVCVGLYSQTLSNQQMWAVAPKLALTWPDLKPHVKYNSPEEVSQVWQDIEKGCPFTRERIISELGALGYRGTRIFIFNLKKGRKGEYELAWSPNDIFIREHSKPLKSRDGAFRDAKVPMDYSLKEYLARLYVQPRMDIKVQDQPVHAVEILKTFKSPVSVQDLPLEHGKCRLNLGFSPVEKKNNNCGIHYYHKGRLITSYERRGLGAFSHRAYGIIGMLRVHPKRGAEDDFLRPKNTKQEFANDSSKAEVDAWVEEQVRVFYEKYFSGEKVEEVVDKSLLISLDNWVACERCNKWRRQKEPWPADRAFYCWYNPDKARRDCEVPEEEAEVNEITTAVCHDNKVVLGTKLQQPKKRKDDSASGRTSKSKKV